MELPEAPHRRRFREFCPWNMKFYLYPFCDDRKARLFFLDSITRIHESSIRLRSTNGKFIFVISGNKTVGGIFVGY